MKCEMTIRGHECCNDAVVELQHTEKWFGLFGEVIETYTSPKVKMCRKCSEIWQNHYASRPGMSEAKFEIRELTDGE